MPGRARADVVQGPTNTPCLYHHMHRWGAPQLAQARSVACPATLPPAATGRRSKEIRSISRVRHLLAEPRCQPPARAIQPLCGLHLSVTAGCDSTCSTAPSGCCRNTWDHRYVKDVEVISCLQGHGCGILPRSPCSARRSDTFLVLGPWTRPDPRQLCKTPFGGKQSPTREKSFRSDVCAFV